MHPIAHHLGEQALAPLLLLGSAGIPLVVAIGRARLAAARAKLTRPRKGRDHRRLPPDDPARQGA
jgi:hypothetical protein